MNTFKNSQIDTTAHAQSFQTQGFGRRTFAKYAGVALACVLGAALTACGSQGAQTSDNAASQNNAAQEVTLRVGASPAPHAEILKQVQEDLKAQGVKLEIVEYTDYVIPNVNLNNKEDDANYFQHPVYLEDYNKKNGTNLVGVANIHFEPLSLYPGKTKALADLQDGAAVAVPNDTTNEARALLLLQQEGLITLPADAGLSVTVKDIVSNPKNLKIVELEAAAIPRAIQDVDVAVINGNYALEAGFKPSDALARESKDSKAAQTYPNIIAVTPENKDNPAIQKLIKALQSDKVKDFINKTYQGQVVAVF